MLNIFNKVPFYIFKGIVWAYDCAAFRPHNNCSILDFGICVVGKWDGLPFLKKSHSADIYIVRAIFRILIVQTRFRYFRKLTEIMVSPWHMYIFISIPISVRRDLKFVVFIYFYGGPFPKVPAYRGFLKKNCAPLEKKGRNWKNPTQAYTWPSYEELL